MKLVNLKNPVMASWMREQGARLDAPPFLSGAIEARKLLEQLSVKKEPLASLTKGHNGGIFNGPQFSRTYVDDPEHGVPFVGSTDMLKADLSRLPLLRKQNAHSPKLFYLRLEEGMTLISCSGTIGRMVYVRPEMAGMWSSQHVMKVVPDPDHVLPGYLYAFLSSKFGAPLVVGGTYGAIIQHIEPYHIANLPVPRLGKKLEASVHKLVQEAAEARTRATERLLQAQQLFLEQLGINAPKPASAYKRPLVGSCFSQDFRERGDAFYYTPVNRDARAAFDRAEGSDLVPLGTIAHVFIPSIFKRLYADDSAYGYPYITGSDVFQLAPTSEKYLLKQVAKEKRLVLQKGMIVIQEAGQLGGLIGRSVQVGSYLNGFACTNNMVRVTPKDKNDAGYLFTVLSSEYGVRLIAREAAGSSIPHLEEGRAAAVEIPWPQKNKRTKIGEPALEAQKFRDEAIEKENKARHAVESAIDEAS